MRKPTITQRRKDGEIRPGFVQVSPMAMDSSAQAIDRIAADIRALVGAGLTATQLEYLVEAIRQALATGPGEG